MPRKKKNDTTKKRIPKKKVAENSFEELKNKLRHQKDALNKIIKNINHEEKNND